MNTKKIIGIVSGRDSTKDGNRYCLNSAYCESVSRAGGITVIIPCDASGAEQLLPILDGLILSGGGDIAPRYFGQRPHEKTSNIIPERDEFEVSLCRLALAYDIPTLCICRGLQVLNVACGGTLLQHIEDHSQKEARHISSHSIKIQKESRLYNIFRQEYLRVNSFHHQAAERLGNGLVVSAVSEDGYIEAIECPNKKFFIGVQWHPEAYAAFLNEQLPIFSALCN